HCQFTFRRCCTIGVGQLSVWIPNSTFMKLCAYVSLGSNLGDRAANLLLAMRGMLDADLVVTRLSAIYETAPVDVREQPCFLNMVAELRGGVFSPEQTLARLLRIEYSLGRRREIPRGPGTIDL